MKKSILIVFGGYSFEHYVSCKSAANILENIDENKYDILKLGITTDGEWLLTEATIKEIEDGTSWASRSDNKIAVISPRRNDHAIIIFEEYNYTRKHIDCVLLITHGNYGEDGAIQGLLELANIPYVSSGVAASACCMDKKITRMFADSFNIKRPRSIDVSINNYEYALNRDKFLELNFPVFVKPSIGGSSIGITKVDNIDDLHEAIINAFKICNDVLIEEGIYLQKELSVCICGKETLEIGELSELTIPQNRPFDYESKYVSHDALIKIPANVSDEIKQKAQQIAITMYKALNCSSWARVDLFLDKDNEVYFNEVNTIPAFTMHSIVPKAFEEIGISQTDFITKLIENAFETSCFHSIEQEFFKSILI